MNYIFKNTYKSFFMSFRKILQDRKKFFPASLYHSFRVPFQVQKAQSSYYYSTNDNIPFLDLYNNVAHVGHSNPAILQAVIEAYQTINIHTRYLNKNLTNYVARLSGYLPKGYKILFTNSGSQSNDLALQIVLRAHKNQIIGSFKRSYHGTTWLCNQISHLTPTGVQDQKEKLINVQFFDPEDSVQVLTNNPKVKSFILETIQGVGGNMQISIQWMKAIRNHVDIMICDEVQTGFGRSGQTFWAWQKAQILPDIITCGKPIANGYPMGACIFKQQLERFLPSTYFNTFGGNSAACLVANAVLNEIQGKGLVENSRNMGNFLKDQLQKLDQRIIKVTGRGLYLGVHFRNDVDAREIVQKLKENHIIVGIGYKDVLRVKPPLVINRKDLEQFLIILKGLLAGCVQNGLKRNHSSEEVQIQSGSKRAKN